MSYLPHLAPQGHTLPQFEPITVHFTFQFGDTGSYPHGKRQRAREAALWAVDPPSYFDEGIFVALDGPTYPPEKQDEIYGRFPSWSPVRHMFMDAPQRQAVRDLLGLATAADAIVVLPTLYCHCDRYWGFMKNCRFPMAQNMSLPFACPQDALYDPTRWAKKSVRWREHTFLDNPNIPPAFRKNTVTLRVAAAGQAVQPSTASVVEVPHGTPMSEVRRLVLLANPAVRVIKVSNIHLRRLCRWLGSRARNRGFNLLTKYILAESSRVSRLPSTPPRLHAPSTSSTPPRLHAPSTPPRLHAYTPTRPPRTLHALHTLRTLHALHASALSTPPHPPHPPHHPRPPPFRLFDTSRTPPCLPHSALPAWLSTAQKRIMAVTIGSTTARGIGRILSLRTTARGGSTTLLYTLKKTTSVPQRAGSYWQSAGTQPRVRGRLAHTPLPMVGWRTLHCQW